MFPIWSVSGAFAPSSEPHRTLLIATLHGVALTSSVSLPGVATRLALLLHLHPFCLSAWALAFSADQLSGRFPFQLGSTPGLLRTLEDLIRFPVHNSVLTADNRCYFVASIPSLRFFAPSTLPIRGVYFPAIAFSYGFHRSFRLCLVAVFQSRFVPPSPFLSTLVVYSSPNPVTSFSHSRP